MKRTKDPLRIQVKKPVAAFKSCPCCKSANLIPVDEQVLCGTCGWNSITAYVAAGGCDFGIKRKGETSLSHSNRKLQTAELALVG